MPDNGSSIWAALAKASAIQPDPQAQQLRPYLQGQAPPPPLPGDPAYQQPALRPPTWSEKLYDLGQGVAGAVKNSLPGQLAQWAGLLDPTVGTPDPNAKYQVQQGIVPPPEGEEATSLARKLALFDQLGITPKDPELARQLRAYQQGYRTDVYHGTDKTFSQFDRQTRDGDFGIHVSSTPDAANRILERSVLNPASGHRELTYRPSAQILPLKARIRNALPLPDVGWWGNPVDWGESLIQQRLLQNGEGGTLAGTNFERRVGDNPIEVPSPILDDLLQLAAKHGSPYYTLSGRAGGNSSSFIADLTRWLQEHGYDAIQYSNNLEGRGEPSYMLLDPRQLRSRWAQFDPAKFGKTADLLAGLGIGAVAATAKPQQ